MLLFSQIGFWREVCRQKMPLTRTLVQTEQEDFDELVQASALPCFSSDWAIRQYGKPQNRIVIPISDPEGTAVYHFLCRREDRRKFSPLIGAFSGGKKAEKQKPEGKNPSGFLLAKYTIHLLRYRNPNKIVRTNFYCMSFCPAAAASPW